VAAILEELELDLEVFTGPFDLLLTLVLREEVDLLEVELADVVVSYLDVLEARGELDLEAATEFLVLIAALLELKSRLLLPGADGDEPADAPEPTEAAEELLARMLEARRYRAAAEHLRGRLASQAGVRYRSAPVPAWVRRGQVALPDPAPGAPAPYRPERLGAALGGLLRMPPRVDVAHLGQVRVSVADRLAHLRTLLRRRGACSFDDAVAGADRTTVCVTLFALLELYKAGEATWTQDAAFGEIRVQARTPATPLAGAVS